MPKDLSNCNSLGCKDEAKNDTCIIMTALTSVIAVKEPEVAISPNLEQEEMCSESTASCSLEMVDASNPTWKDNKGLEMSDPSHPMVVHNNNSAQS